MVSGSKPLTKGQIVSAIAERCDLTRKQASAALDCLADLVAESLSPQGPGAFSLPGILKIEKKDVPAKPARFGVPNPFRPGETMDIAAKPASTKIRIRPLKNLKEMA